MKFRRVEKIPFQIIDEKAVVLNVKTSQAHELNESLALVWSNLENPIELDQLVLLITENYIVDVETAKKDTLNALYKLIEFGIVESHE